MISFAQPNLQINTFGFSKMDNVSVNVRLRPVRFAFMVRPEDGAGLQRIFHINTCLWGGLYNPIVPFFKRVPAWWERNGIRFDNAKQIVNGYLDYFEPDFVVEAEKNIASGFGIDPKRVLQLADILSHSGQREEKGHGLSVLDLYRKLYRDEYQFVRRHKHNIIDAKAAAPKFDNFTACVFGGFPKQQSLKYFATAFKDAFDPEEIKLDGATLQKLYKSQFSSALNIGHDGIEVNYNDHRDPTIFILNAEEPKDLLDFWNYRAVHRSGIPIPVQWLQELSAFCKDFVIKNYRPLPGNPNGVMIRPTIMFSRSIPEKNIEILHKKYLAVDKQGANSVQTWYPPIWRQTPGYTVRTTRPKLTALSKKCEVTVEVDKPHIRFESLYPEFADQFGGNHRWANIMRIEDWSFKDRIATVFPTDFRIQAVPRFGLGGEFRLSTNEGLVNFPRFKEFPQQWDLIEGREAIEQWLTNNKITSRLSESGRATQQIIQTLGGFWSVRSLSHRGIIELLDEMARRPIKHSAHQREFQNKINIAIKGDIWRDKVLETLVNRRAVELGQELKCTKCGSWGWYALTQLNVTMNCQLCLRPFGFPLTDPTDSKLSKWAYRVIGPFALPKYADGGYAAALAIRFFADVIARPMDTDVTWSPGLELTLPNGRKAEVDFLLWYQHRHMFGTDHPTQIIFGEAKSFGKDAFRDQDVERMRLLAQQHPGAILVFATMKEATELSKDEIKRIRKLAEWGREYDKDRKETRAPVIVLTGTELFTAYYLEQVWKEKGGRHKQLVEPAYVDLNNLKQLADCTQQLYLGMTSFGVWREAIWKKKRERLAKSKTGLTALMGTSRAMV